MKKNKSKDIKQEKKTKEEDNGIAIGMCLGICLGSAIGVATDNIALWIPIGLCLGLALGTAFSEKNDKKGKK